MDGKELLQTLSDYARQHGIESLSPVERDYLDGRITYIGYLQRCYADYAKGGLFSSRPAHNPGKGKNEV